VTASGSDSTHAWLERIVDSLAVDQLARELERADRVVAQGARGSIGALLSGSLALRMNAPVLFVVAHLDEADDALEDLDLFAQRVKACRFGALEVLPGETNVNLELLAERLSLVEQLAAGQWGEGPSVIVAPIQALMQAVPEPEAIGEFALTLRRGGTMAPSRLMDWLDAAGYRRGEAVEEPGAFAVRGGIVDIYLPSEGGRPVRLDYFGDEIDSIRLIDTDTMGSGEMLDQVQLVGASPSRMQADDRTTNLTSLLPRTTVVLLQEVMELAEQARGYYERIADARGVYSAQGVMKLLTQRKHIEVNQYSVAGEADVPVQLPVDPLEPFDQDGSQAVKQLAERASEPNAEVVALCQNPAERQRLGELLEEHAPSHAATVTRRLGYLHRGFVWTEADRAMHVAPHHEIFHRYQTRRRIRRVGAATEKAADAFLDLEEGDYVVHVDHGIARFTGMKSMRRDGKTQDYLTLEFAQKALLHVPASQIDLVQKYVGGFHGKPPLSTLGGKRWAKQKQQVAEAVRDMAAQMLRMQAARASLPGVRFPSDTPWQREFEAEFPYEETEDQLAAIAAVKKDMADEQPMDRLICGDVGFGKTEVAIRAAFKAAEYGKQVAVLVPTTVLAEQHGRTFGQRMADYPFRIEVLNRFKSAGEVRRLLQELENGRVDMVIGTHRLLSKDVRFADLGLVVIDEEQRFGVEHKNKLLEFRLTADVLTLSATPIPRTLHMSMLGLRDISSLSTAPLDRRAIVTEVVPFDKKRVRQAIYRELNRDGQIYFVHNRVHSLKSVADDIQKLVPEARIVIGHGQMTGAELEGVMLEFLNREADVLVCTTIIESGIDIPTANTMFINEADHYGLADLHQLRGRVGRYKHRAYCYLLLPSDRPVTEKAQRRLKAIEQFAMLGAGFKIAMRDLEIRGAGNLLGSEQSGHIAAVGYEMYCKLLEQETRKLRHEQVTEPSRTHLELPVSGRITARYISSEKRRMEAYKRLSRCETLATFDEVVEDVTEAYGKPPATVQAFFDLTELRVAASRWDIDRLKLDGPDLIFQTRSPEDVASMLRDAPGRTSVIDEKTVYYRPPANYLEPSETLLAVLRKLLVRPCREAADAGGEPQGGNRVSSRSPSPRSTEAAGV